MDPEHDFAWAECHFCKTRRLRPNAIDAGWVPDFWVTDPDVPILSPVCPSCVAQHLTRDEHGEWVLATGGTP